MRSPCICELDYLEQVLIFCLNMALGIFPRYCSLICAQICLPKSYTALHPAAFALFVCGLSLDSFRKRSRGASILQMREFKRLVLSTISSCCIFCPFPECSAALPRAPRGCGVLSRLSTRHVVASRPLASFGFLGEYKTKILLKLI